MGIKAIRTEEDYRVALKEIEELFDAEPNTPDGDRLEALVTLVEAYEAQHYAIPLPDPIAALEYYLESRGLSPEDLEPYIGGHDLVLEILNRERRLTQGMMQNLETHLGIPVEVLSRGYRLSANVEVLLYQGWEHEETNVDPLAMFMRSLLAGDAGGSDMPRDLFIAPLDRLLTRVDKQDAGYESKRAVIPPLSLPVAYDALASSSKTQPPTHSSLERVAL
jgi:HTH-type transcriptional regulator/antitoxin HigA